MAPSADALDNVVESLKQTIEQASARETAWAQRPETTSAAARYLQRLRELAAQRQEAMPAVQPVVDQTAVTDVELQSCEAELRDLAARTETLRQKLAQWATRAVR